MTINRPTSRDDRQYHGLGGTPTYRSWYSMHDRCINPANESYPHYGAKGVTVCQRWDSIEAFVADMGLRPDGMTIDRMDRTKGYEPGNCRWATPKEQARNRKSARLVTALGRTQHLVDWAREAGLSHQLIRHRLRAGWTPDSAVTTPASKSANSRWRRKQ